MVAEIGEQRQVDAIIARVGDDSIQPQELAIELMDLLLTLAADKPSEECIGFLTWRLREWVEASRRSRITHHFVA